MKTEHKYISYRADRDSYQVSIKADGKQVTRTCKTLEEALEKRDALLNLHGISTSALSDLRRKDDVEEIPTLEQAFSEFVENDVRPRVAISTYSKYLLCGRTYGKYLGKMRIHEIKREIWQKVFSSVQEKRSLSYTYMVDDYRRFRSMYEFFIERGVIPNDGNSNPLEKKLKLRKTQKMKRRAFTEQEKEKFLASAWEYHPEWHFIFSLYFQTGCRRGELLAIQWRDVDFDRKRIHIRRNIGRGTVDGKFVELVGQTKTDSSIRSIPISEDNVKRLKALYNERKNCPTPTDFVFQPIFKRVKYEWISLGNIERAFTVIRDRAGIDPSLTIHCIRHTVASKLMTAGVDISTIQSIGGWASPSTLLSIYAHSNEMAKEKAMKDVLF